MIAADVLSEILPTIHPSMPLCEIPDLFATGWIGAFYQDARGHLRRESCAGSLGCVIELFRSDT